MTKEEALGILMLLSALESWCYGASKEIPAHLSERVDEAVEVLKTQIFGEM